VKQKKKQSVNSSAPEISFIISAYDRPMCLSACLATLALQTERAEFIVCINSQGEMFKRHAAICDRYGAIALPTGKMGARCCYSSADLAAKFAKGEWLCFPSDDSLYVPGFSDLMLRAAREANLDLVYCDMVYDPMGLIQRVGRYGLMDSRPQINCIDKTNFIVKRKFFKGFPGKKIEGHSACDVLFVEDAIRRGARHGKAEGILGVHN